MYISPDKARTIDFDEVFSDGFGHISLSQLGEDLFICRHFEKRPPGFYLDVGAFHPKKYSNTYLLRRFYGWGGINVDANPDAIELFEKYAANDTNLNLAISDKLGEAELTIYNGAAHSTIDEARKIHNSKKNLDVNRVVKIQTNSIEAIIDEYAQGREIDFLSIDVEGMDLVALKSANLDKNRPELICVEDHEFVGRINRGQISEICAFMRSKDYKFASHNLVSSFYIRK